MIRVLSDAGEKTSWARDMNRKEQDALYRAGRRIEIDYVLQECRDVLRSRGQLFVVDEVEPAGFVYRWFLRAVRYPMRLVTFLVLQAKDLKSSKLWKKILYYVIEFPLMLLTFVVVPPATQPIRDLEARVKNAGFRLVRSSVFLGGTLRLLQAERLA